MKKISRFILLCTLLLIISFPAFAQEAEAEPVPNLRPLPASTVISEEGITVELYFESLPQGRVGLVRATGDNLSGARIRFREVTSDCFYIEDDAYYGFIVANMDQTPRVYEFSVLAWLEDGSRVTIPAQVNIVQGGFITQDFNLSADRAYLVDPEVERLEFARLDSIFASYTTARYWEEGFQYPTDSELTSTFGAYRIINQTVETRHTGWDLRAPVGTPVMTMGSGEVAFAGVMDIRGNFVVINHGYGVFSTYSHLSQVHVTRGQTVTKGQIIGVSGNTGRSGGPHLHWEMVVNGQFIDSADFMQMWLP